MPRLSVWMLRAALLHLGVGLTFGALMLANKGVPFEPMLWRLLSAHSELLLLGWTMQLATGVALWILPRFSSAPKYGNVTLGWLVFVLLNTGVIMVVAAAWIGPDAALFAGIGRIIELLAALIFAAHIWRRVKAFAV